jgi:hypothetical protein
MRNYIVIAAMVWALSAIPSMAQDPAAGAAVGAGVGAAAGAAEGARPRDRVVVEPAPRDHVIVEPGSGSSETTCVHSPGTTSCTEVRH